MALQNYTNHIRWYTPHHFIFYPVVGGAAVISAWYAFTCEGRTWEWLAISGIFLSIAWLSYMLRQHYALTNQDRIVRLELRFRYYVVTQKRLEEIEAQLSEGQLYALRFAPDDELVSLAHRAVKENLSADEIKRSIKNWLPDHKRV